MNKFLSQYDLTPGERRVIVIIFLVVIIVLNSVFVWPHFGDWGKIKRDLAKLRDDTDKATRQIAEDTKPNGIHDQVVKLMNKETKEGANMSAEHVADPQIQLQNTVLAQERKTGVVVETQNAGSVKTNDAFFEEHSLQLSIQAEEPQLVNFLYNMGMDPAMIRVARIDLHPLDANRYKLRGTLMLTASYTKQTPVVSNGKPSTTPAKLQPGAKPAQKPAPATVKSPKAQSAAAPAPHRGPPAPRTVPAPNNASPNENQPGRRQPNMPPGVSPPGFGPGSRQLQRNKGNQNPSSTPQ